jgi:hypothetical protein
MRYTIPLAVILCAVSAMTDVALGLTTPNLNESFMLRMAAITIIIAIYINLMRWKQSWKSLPFVLISLLLSAASFFLGNADPVILADVMAKMATTALTIKPDLIEIEITTEEEESQNKTRP